MQTDGWFLRSEHITDGRSVCPVWSVTRIAHHKSYALNDYLFVLISLFRKSFSAEGKKKVLFGFRVSRRSLNTTDKKQTPWTLQCLNLKSFSHTAQDNYSV